MDRQNKRIVTASILIGLALCVGALLFRSKYEARVIWLTKPKNFISVIFNRRPVYDTVIVCGCAHYKPIYFNHGDGVTMRCNQIRFDSILVKRK